jgi:Ran GTPase-activating protein (RanGAP) involved in mRNA processing and transport
MSLLTPENHTAIENLKSSYEKLSSFSKFIFPSAVSSALNNYKPEKPLTAHQVFHAFSNQTWFFQRWFISCLYIFSKANKPKPLNAFVFDLLTLFEQLPADTTMINLNDNYIIPFRLVSPSVIDNHGSRQNGENVAAALQGLPKSITTIDLNNITWALKEPSELPLALQSLPRNLRSLNLSSNLFGSKNRDMPHIDRLVAAFKALPKNLIDIDLSFNFVGFPGRYLSLILGALPQGIKSINLSHNLFGLHDNRAWLIESLKKIPDSVRSINLSNNFISRNIFNLEETLAALPQKLTSLNLSAGVLNAIRLDVNGLPMDKKTIGNIIAQAFLKLPPTIQSLDLSNNGFDYPIDYDLSAVFKNLPRDISFLEFSNNNLGFDPARAREEGLGKLLAAALKALPPSLKTLDLSENNLNYLTADILPDLKDSLPHIKTLWLSYEEVDKMERGQLLAIMQMLPESSQIKLKDSNNKGVHFPEVLRRKKMATTLQATAAFFVQQYVNSKEIVLPDYLRVASAL